MTDVLKVMHSMIMLLELLRFLELCEIFRNTQTHYDLKFIFFGAEEINLLGRGLHGSYNYVESLSDSDKEKIKYMINLDTLLSGDNMYVYNVYKDEKIDEIDNIFFAKADRSSSKYGDRYND